MFEKRRRRKAIQRAKYKKWERDFQKDLEERVHNLEENLPKTNGFSHKILSDRLKYDKEMLNALLNGNLSAIVYDDKIELSPEELEQIEIELRA